MRWLAVLLLLAACGSRDRGSDPPWPKSAGHEKPDKWEDDGGESLDPRREHMGAVESSKEPTPPGEVQVVEPVVETPLGIAPDAGVPADAAPATPPVTDAGAPASPAPPSPVPKR
jgi:hypothetical protein